MKRRLLVEVFSGARWEPVFVPTYPESRLMRWMRKFRLLSATISGFCPRSVHLRDAIGPASWVTWCHEADHHIEDYLTAPWPRLITHPVRSLWDMRKGYEKSPREIRAYAAQQWIANGEHPRIRPTAETRKLFKP